MIYVGRELKALSGSTDPCLVNPALSIAAHANISEREFGCGRPTLKSRLALCRTYLELAGRWEARPQKPICGYILFFWPGAQGHLQRIEGRAGAERLAPGAQEAQTP